MNPQPETLARRLGTTPHVSALLRKARKLGLHGSKELCLLAVQRGCRHYAQGDEPDEPLASHEQFSDEELAIALLHPSLPHDPHRLRCGAAMVASDQNDPESLAHLARQERAVPVLRYVAESGRRYEPENPFWNRLLSLLPATPPIKPGVMPHPTRFVAMTGFTPRGREFVTEWLRPESAPAKAA
jgi:hypothetical protein